MRVDDQREELRKDEGEVLTRGFSDNIKLGSLTSGNNEVRGGDIVFLTRGEVSGTGSTDSRILERTSKRGR